MCEVQRARSAIRIACARGLRAFARAVPQKIVNSMPQRQNRGTPSLRQGARHALLWASDRLSSLWDPLNFEPAIKHMDDFVVRFLRDWWLSIPLVMLFLVVATAGLAQRITAPT